MENLGAVRIEIPVLEQDQLFRDNYMNFVGEGLDGTVDMLLDRVLAGFTAKECTDSLAKGE